MSELLEKARSYEAKKEIVDQDQQVPARSCDLTLVVGRRLISVNL